MLTFHIEKPSQAICGPLKEKIDDLTKPKGSLGLLEEVALQIGLIQQTLTPRLESPHNIIFAGDHGIADEGVSLSPKEITRQMIGNFLSGGAGVNFLARQHRFTLQVVDSAVDFDFPPLLGLIDRKIRKGTRNFLYEPALTAAETERALEAGAEIVSECAQTGCNVIGFGEMGIGNTSASSMWMTCLTDIPLGDCVGAGSGLDAEGIRRKYDVLSRALANYTGYRSGTVSENIPGNTSGHLTGNRSGGSSGCVSGDTAGGLSGYNETFHVMRYFGGLEMVMAVGGMLRAAELKMIVLIDGFIMTNCILAASKMYPAVLDYCIFGHQGDEAGHKRVLDYLGAKPLLRLNLRLGEGTGAICAYPLVESAVRMINEMNTFGNASITKYF